MKKILIFSLSYFPHVGGAEVATHEITKRITDIEFHLITLRFHTEKREERVGNVLVHRVGDSSSYMQKILFIPRAARMAARLHRVHHFDAFWAMMSYMVFPVVLLRLFGVPVPYVLTLQDGDPFSRTFNRWFILPFRPLLMIGFRGATRVSALSTYLAVWAKRMGYLCDVAIVPNGADLVRFQAGTHATLETGGIVNLVTASRLVHKNALDDVIRSLVLLPPNVQFIIYGSGPEERALRRLAEDLGVTERVLFKGYAPHSELARAFATTHIFIRPSRTEGFGASFTEAMAAGVPVIATQEGGITDFLFDEKRNPDRPTTGWAVDVNSPEHIALAVKDIMTNPDKVNRVRANALALVHEKYNWDTIALQMKNLFEEVSARRTMPV